MLTVLLFVLVIIDDVVVGNLVDRLRQRDLLGAGHYVRDITRQLCPVWLLLGTAALAAAIVVNVLARVPNE